MQTVRIGICDDEAIQRENVRRIVASWAEKTHAKADAEEYESAEALLFALDGGAHFDILLLDVQMAGMDGVSLAERVRESGDDAEIVFISAYPDFIARGYDVDALHYLMKPVADKHLHAVLNKAAARRREEKPRLFLPTSEGNVRVGKGEILFAESFSHEVELTLIHGKMTARIAMNELEALLGDGFFRCHRSYIVNMAYVRRVTRGAMALDGGLEVPLSRNRYDAANQAFIRCV